MAKGLPPLTGTDRVGIAVPDIEAATRFLVDVVGCTAVSRSRRFAVDDDWMEKGQAMTEQLTVIAHLRALDGQTEETKPSCKS
jgi:catechol 2,3-dioxygenase-like lactoylglutathione lyase family enzyme